MWASSLKCSKTLKLNEVQVLTTVSTGDVTANEIYYHKNCFMWFNNKYSAAIKQETATSDNPSENFFQELHFRKIILFVKEQCNTHEKFSFVAAELQSMYNELIKSDKISVSPHVSLFTECLLDAFPEFKLQKFDRKNTITYSQEVDHLVKDKLKEINQSSLAKELLKVALPIPKQMSKVTNFFHGNSPINCQQESIPLSLLSLCSLLIDGADPTPTDVSQAALSVSKLIMFSYKKQSKIVQTNEISLENWRHH